MMKPKTAKGWLGAAVAFGSVAMVASYGYYNVLGKGGFTPTYGHESTALQPAPRQATVTYIPQVVALPEASLPTAPSSTVPEPDVTYIPNQQLFRPLVRSTPPAPQPVIRHPLETTATTRQPLRQSTPVPPVPVKPVVPVSSPSAPVATPHPPRQVAASSRKNVDSAPARRWRHPAARHTRGGNAASITACALSSFCRD